MTNWVVLQLSDLNTYLAAPQVRALETAALAEGQSGRFSEVMGDTSRRIRVAIQSNPANVISATEFAIPPELKAAACHLILEAMQAAVPGLRLSDDQRSLVQRAELQLRRISERLDAVTIPQDPLASAAVQRGGFTHLVTRQPREVDRDQTRHL